MSFGCAAQRVSTVTQPCTKKLSSYDCLQINQFDFSEDFKKAKLSGSEYEKKYYIMRDGFQTRVQHQIYSLNLFDDVIIAKCPDDAESIIMLNGDITYMKRVSRADRIAAGALAGKARVDIEVDLVDFQSGEVVGEASFQGTSSGGSMFAGTTEQALENTSQLIADFIKNSY